MKEKVLRRPTGQALPTIVVIISKNTQLRRQIDFSLSTLVMFPKQKLN